jgi:quercetin dioxygenase-like cupin family protein
MKKIISIMFLFTACCVVHAQYNSSIVVQSLLKTDTTSLGQAIAYPHDTSAEVSVVKVRIPFGASTGWHQHHIPVFAYVLQGTLTVQFENGTEKEFLPNTSFAEVLDTFHNGTNKGKDDVVLLVFYAGEKGKPLSIKR